jgi:hypothetical protein
MSIQLGDLELSDHLILVGLDSSTMRATQISRSIYGVAIYNNGVALMGGIELSLLSQNHIYYDQLQALRLLEETGEAVSLVHPRGTYRVRITGNDLAPDREVVDPFNDPDLWYSGSIYLLTV